MWPGLNELKTPSHKIDEVKEMNNKAGKLQAQQQHSPISPQLALASKGFQSDQIWLFIAKMAILGIKWREILMALFNPFFNLV